MFINSSDLAPIAFLESRSFDKEGYLFIKERSDGIFLWKSEQYIERLCRLKGNLLFILATQSFGDAITVSPQKQRQDNVYDRIVNILILEDFVIKPVDEDKHFGFLIEFLKHEASNKQVHFATLSHNERDSWIQSIHLTSLSYLRTLYRSLAAEYNEKISLISNDLKPFECDKYKNNTSLAIIAISCENLTTEETFFEPNVFVKVFYRTLSNFWIFLDQTEVVSSRSPYFAKKIFLPAFIHPSSSVEFKFKVFNCTEPITRTETLIGEVVLKVVTLRKSVNRKLGLNSPAGSYFTGILSCTITSLNEIRLVRFLSLPSLINSHCNSSFQKCKKDLCKNWRSVSLPNLSVKYSTMTSNLLYSCDKNLFINPIEKVFQFITSSNDVLRIEEIMAESSYSFILPQILM